MQPNNPAATAWLDALSGNMNFQGDRSKYHNWPADPNQNPVMAFIRQLANETMLMPQNATAGWINAFGPPPGLNSLMPKPPVAPANPMALPPGNVNAGGITPPKMTRTSATQPSAGTFSVPLAKPLDYNTMVQRNEGTGKNPRSSAEGPGQFIDSTFNEYLKDKGLTLGQGDVPADLPGAKAKYGTDAIDWYKQKNSKILAGQNIPVNDTTLYGSHFLGAGGLSKIWNADPTTPVAQLLDADAIAANPEVLSGKTAGEVKAWLGQKTSGDVLPRPPLAEAPPQLDAPPQMAAPKTLDFSQQNQFLEEARPKPLNQAGLNDINLANVLQGLAGGAASVDATKAGSFAAALAAAGAGGMAGRGKAAQLSFEAGQKKDSENQQYALTRANAAGTQMTQAHANEAEQSRVAFQNAKAVYDTNVANANKAYEVKQENAKTKYEGDLKERAARMPTVKSDANGITIQQYNPATNSMDLQYHPTKSILEQGESAEKIVKALGAPGPVAESMFVSHIAKTIQNPQLAQAVLESEAVRRTIQNGAGAAVFGKAYEAAMKQAQKEVDASLASDPVKYQEALQKVAASNIYNALAKRGDRGWLKAAAANGSIIAGVIGGGGPQ